MRWTSADLAYATAAAFTLACRESPVVGVIAGGQPGLIASTSPNMVGTIQHKGDDYVQAWKIARIDE